MNRPSRRPSSDVGSEVIFENDVVRVWEMRLETGERSAYHRHELDYLFVYATPSQIEVTQADDATEEQLFEAGYVQFVNVGDGTEHEIRNTAAERHVQYVIELKPPSGRAPSSHNGRRRLIRTGTRGGQ